LFKEFLEEFYEETSDDDEDDGDEQSSDKETRLKKFASGIISSSDSDE
jgi:hypothetical protein